jgi:hypothetical protein
MVIDAAGELRVVGENRLDDEFTASPAVGAGRICLRGQKSLCAVGK